MDVPIFCFTIIVDLNSRYQVYVLCALISTGLFLLDRFGSMNLLLLIFVVGSLHAVELPAYFQQRADHVLPVYHSIGGFIVLLI